LANNDSREKAIAAGNSALEKKAEDVRVLDMRMITSFCDYFVIAGAESSKKTTAIADHIIDSLYMFGIRPARKEGRKEGRWVILDYSDVVIHVFQEEARRFYDLERLWGDARSIIIKDNKKGAC
jgi:ribosome-associated protein